MNGLEETLNAILSDPNTIAQVANLAQSLHLGGAFGQEDSHHEPPCPPAQAASPPAEAGDLLGLGDMLGQIDPSMISRMLPLVRELTASDCTDERMALLMALRPFLKPERREKIERAVKTARLLRVGKQVLTAMGDSHV